MSYTNAYVRTLEKWYWWSNLQGTSGDTDIENRFVDLMGEGGGGKEAESSMETTICKIDRQWEFIVWLRAQTGALGQPREVGKEVQEGGDMCIPMADSCWCVAETNTTL